MKGEIVERGTHEELLAQEGFYYNLYLSQFKRQEQVRCSVPVRPNGNCARSATQRQRCTGCPAGREERGITCQHKCHLSSNLPTAVSQQTQLSPTLAINERVSQLWAAGKSVYHLGFGESRFPVHPKIGAALAANVHQTSYPPTLGIPELRAAAARFYSRAYAVPIAASQIIVGPGSKPLSLPRRWRWTLTCCCPRPRG